MGGRTQKFCSGVKTDGNNFKDGIYKGGSGGCEAESEPYGTVSLFRHTLSEVRRSLSTKCLLHKKKYFYNILAESVVHNWLTFSALSLELKKSLHYRCLHNLISVSVNVSRVLRLL